MPLTTLAAFKAYHGVQSDNSNAVLEPMVAAVTPAICGHLGYEVERKTYVEPHDGNGGSAIFLRQRPVISVASVVVNEQTIPKRTSSAGGGWVNGGPAGRRLVVQGYRFSKGAQNVVVTYDAGFEVVPADIVLAAHEWIAFEFKKAQDRIGLNSVSISATGETVSFTPTNVPDFVAKRLAPYVNPCA